MPVSMVGPTDSPLDTSEHLPGLVVMAGAVDGGGGRGTQVMKTAVLGASLSRSQREEAKRALSRYANNLNLNTNMYI